MGARMARPARAGRAALVLVIAASCLRYTPGDELVDPSSPTSANDAAPENVADTDTLIRPPDALIWHERGANRRKVLATIEIPPGRDVVVVEPRGGDSALAGDSLKFLEVNSVRILTPSTLRHIEIRSGEAGRLQVTLLVSLPHCAHLDLAVWDYTYGRHNVQVLKQDPQALPDCCITAPTAAPEPEGSASLPSPSGTGNPVARDPARQAQPVHRSIRSAHHGLGDRNRSGQQDPWPLTELAARSLRRRNRWGGVVRVAMVMRALRPTSSNPKSSTAKCSK